MLFFIQFIFSMLMILLSVAFITLLERKVLSYSQNRVGPNKVSIGGIFQPMLDGLKLFLKELNMNFKMNKLLFYFSPMFSFTVMLFLWTIFPSYFFTLNLKYSVLFFLCVIGISIYSVLLAGWSSNSKYALLGGIRASAQSVSYEISLSLIIFSMFLLLKSFNFFFLMKSDLSLILLFFPLLVCWFLSCVAECNRAPFDFAEGESELVSGFNVEYGSVDFALIFISEYGMIIFFSLLTSFLFFSKNNIMFLFITIIMINSMLILRSVYPRFRYDKLMYLSWFKFLPISCFYFLLVLFICF